MTVKTWFEKIVLIVLITLMVGFYLGHQSGFMDAAKKCNAGKLFQLHKPFWEWDFSDPENDDIDDFSDSGVGCIDDCLEPLISNPTRKGKQ